MSHDVKIDDNWIEQDYGFILENIDIAPPTPRTTYVMVPGRDGVLDYSEAVAGRITYDTRPIVLTLVAEKNNPEEVDIIKDRFIRNVHGRIIRMLPGWQDLYYEGRATVEISNYRPNFVRLKTKMTAEPYRTANEDVEVTAVISGETHVELINNGDVPVSPIITTNDEISISYDTWQYVVEEGTYTLPFVIPPGTSDLTVSGSAEVTFVWRERFL